MGWKRGDNETGETKGSETGEGKKREHFQRITAAVESSAASSSQTGSQSTVMAVSTRWSLQYCKRPG